MYEFCNTTYRYFTHKMQDGQKNADLSDKIEFFFVYYKITEFLYLLLSIWAWCSAANNGRYSGSGKLVGNFTNSALKSCNHGMMVAFFPCWLMESRSICHPDSSLRLLGAPSLLVDCVATWVTSSTDVLSVNIYNKATLI